MAGQAAEEAIERFTDVLIAERDLRIAKQKLDMTLSILPERDKVFYWSESSQLRRDFEALATGV